MRWAWSLGYARSFGKYLNTRNEARLFPSQQSGRCEILSLAHLADFRSATAILVAFSNCHSILRRGLHHPSAIARSNGKDICRHQGKQQGIQNEVYRVIFLRRWGLRIRSIVRLSCPFSICNSSGKTTSTKEAMRTLWL